jgi:DnaJ domain/Leucine Rich repeat
MNAKNHYEILGVPTWATQEQIEASYRRLARKYHPDRNPDPSSHQRMQEIIEARDVLSNPRRRRDYDAAQEVFSFRHPGGGSTANAGGAPFTTPPPRWGSSAGGAHYSAPPPRGGSRANAAGSPYSAPPLERNQRWVAPLVIVILILVGHAVSDSVERSRKTETVRHNNFPLFPKPDNLDDYIFAPGRSLDLERSKVLGSPEASYGTLLIEVDGGVPNGYVEFSGLQDGSAARTGQWSIHPNPGVEITESERPELPPRRWITVVSKTIGGGSVRLQSPARIDRFKFSPGAYRAKYVGPWSDHLQLQVKGSSIAETGTTIQFQIRFGEIVNLHVSALPANGTKSPILDSTMVTDTDAWLKKSKDLTNCTSLDLSGTKVTDAGLNELKEHKRLTGLKLASTEVTDVGLNELKNVKTLTKLDLRVTKVTDAGLRELKDLYNLTTLDLSDTRVTGVGLKEVKSLTTLDLHSTLVTDEGLKELKHLKNLTTLNLDATAVTGVGLKDLKNLTTLSLRTAKVTDAGLKELADFKNLTTLDLEYTKVTDAGLKELKDLKNLTSLNLGQTWVTEAGVKELKKALPKCSIAH